MNVEAEMRAALQARWPEYYGDCPDCDGEGAYLWAGEDWPCVLCAGTGRVTLAALAEVRGEMLGTDKSVETTDARPGASGDA